MENNHQPPVTPHSQKVCGHCHFNPCLYVKYETAIGRYIVRIHERRRELMPTREAHDMTTWHLMHERADTNKTDQHWYDRAPKCCDDGVGALLRSHRHWWCTDRDDVIAKHGKYRFNEDKVDCNPSLKSQIKQHIFDSQYNSKQTMHSTKASRLCLSSFCSYRCSSAANGGVVYPVTPNLKDGTRDKDDKEKEGG